MCIHCHRFRKMFKMFSLPTIWSKSLPVYIKSIVLVSKISFDQVKKVPGFISSVPRDKDLHTSQSHILYPLEIWSDKRMTRMK